MKLTFGNLVAVAGVIAALVVAMLVVASPGKASAHPYDAPQIGDFVPGSFNCTGDVAPWGARYAEFSGTWQGVDDAQLEFVQFVDGKEAPVTSQNLFSGVDANTFHGLNILTVAGVHGNAFLRQAVVFHLEPVTPDTEVGVYAKWLRPAGAKPSDRALLAKWKGSEKYKCGMPRLG